MSKLKKRTSKETDEKRRESDGANQVNEDNTVSPTPAHENPTSPQNDDATPNTDQNSSSDKPPDTQQLENEPKKVSITVPEKKRKSSTRHSLPPNPIPVADNSHANKIIYTAKRPSMAGKQRKGSDPQEKAEEPTTSHRKNSGRKSIRHSLPPNPILVADNAYIDKFFDQNQKKPSLNGHNKIKKKRRSRKSRPSGPELGPSPDLLPPILEDEEPEKVRRFPAKVPSFPAKMPVKPFGSLHSIDSFLKAVNSISDGSRSSGRPDMTWVRGDSYSSSEGEEMPSSESHHVESLPGIRRLLSFVSILGCLPLVIYSDQRESGHISFRCRKKKCWRKLGFYFSTLILGTALTISSIATGHILFTKVDTTGNVEDKAAQYSNFELLMFQKHWMPLTIFLLTLGIAFVGNLTFIFKEKEIITFVNEVGESFQDLNFNRGGERWWRKLAIFHVLLTVLDVVVLFSLVAAGFLGFRESKQFETILYLRWFKERAFLDDKTMDASLYFVIFLKSYAYFVARNHLLFIMILAKWIAQSAQGWNARIAYFLSRVAPMNRKNVEYLGKILSYEVLMKEHLILTKMVRSLSRAFPYTLLAFFGAKLMGICCELFRAAVTFLFDLKVDHGNSTSDTISGTNVKYDPTKEDSAFECGYYLSTTLIGLYVVTMAISEAGDAVMDGFNPVRRYGLMLTNSLKGRKFVMSLFMSFNAKKPHVVKPGWWFYVDKSLFMSIVGTAFFLFSIMIQCRIIHLVEIPIALACSDNPEAMCVKTMESYSQNGEAPEIILEKGILINPLPVLPDVTQSKKEPTILPEKLTTTTTMTSTTTTKPPAPRPKPMIDPNASLEDKMNVCGFYCASNAGVYRMIPFAANLQGSLHSYKVQMIAAYDTLTGSIECMSNPYKFAKRNGYTEFLDCFGNGPYKVEDFHEKAYAAMMEG